MLETITAFNEVGIIEMRQRLMKEVIRTKELKAFLIDLVAHDSNDWAKILEQATRSKIDDVVTACSSNNEPNPALILKMAQSGRYSLGFIEEGFVIMQHNVIGEMPKIAAPLWRLVGYYSSMSFGGAGLYGRGMVFEDIDASSVRTILRARKEELQSKVLQAEQIAV